MGGVTTGCQPAWTGVRYQKLAHHKPTDGCWSFSCSGCGSVQMLQVTTLSTSCSRSRIPPTHVYIFFFFLPITITTNYVTNTNFIITTSLHNSVYITYNIRSFFRVSSSLKDPKLEISKLCLENYSKCVTILL